MRKFTHKVILMVTYATVISLTTMAFAGILWAIIALFTGELSNADFGIYR
jgi:hypothetical protein